MEDIPKEKEWVPGELEQLVDEMLARTDKEAMRIMHAIANKAIGLTMED